MERLPTIEEFRELMEQCTWRWSEVSHGYRVFGPSGKSIFLPLAGNFSSFLSKPCNVGEHGYYWTSTPTFEREAWGVHINTHLKNGYSYLKECNYLSVRLVSDTEGIDLGLSVKWCTLNVGASNAFESGSYFNYNEAIKLNNMERPEIKAGMLVEAGEFKYLVIPTSDGKLVGITAGSVWHSDIQNAKEITKIGWPIGYNSSRKFEFGTIIWEQPKEVVITMQEIADKFGIPVDQLKIKK